MIYLYILCYTLISVFTHHILYRRGRVVWMNCRIGWLQTVVIGDEPGPNLTRLRRLLQLMQWSPQALLCAHSRRKTENIHRERLQLTFSGVTWRVTRTQNDAIMFRRFLLWTWPSCIRVTRDPVLLQSFSWCILNNNNNNFVSLIIRFGSDRPNLFCITINIKL